MHIELIPPGPAVDKFSLDIISFIYPILTFQDSDYDIQFIEEIVAQRSEAIFPKSHS